MGTCICWFLLDIAYDYTSSQYHATIFVLIILKCVPLQILRHQLEPERGVARDRLRGVDRHRLDTNIQDRSGKRDHHGSWFRPRLLRYRPHDRETRKEVDSDSRFPPGCPLPCVFPFLLLLQGLMEWMNSV